jgi:hypothetical protein
VNYEAKQSTPNLHPDVHAPWSQWSNDQTLHVAVAYSNPFRWQSRRQLMNDFRAHMSVQANVVLHVGELAYGDRPFEVTGNHSGDVQLRTNSELFHKENILNEVIKTFPAGWKHGAYIDADFSFTRQGWALETIHQLQHSPWVQPFSTYTALSAKGSGGSQPGSPRTTFAATYIANGYKLPEYDYNAGWDVRAVKDSGLSSETKATAPAKWVPVGATGGAWAFTRSAFDGVGGLLDCCILGHADWFMAFGLVSQPTRGTIANSKFHPHYAAQISGWQERAGGVFKADIGVVDQFAIHHFHGSMAKRGYDSRDQILVKYQFDPMVDLKRNWQGIYELTGNKPGLRDAIRGYFLSRDEDNPNG